MQEYATTSIPKRGAWSKI